MILPFDKPKKQPLNEVSSKKVLFGGNESLNLTEESNVQMPAVNHKLYITKSVNNITPDKAKLISEFIQFCCKHLGITQPCEVYLTGKRGDDNIVQSLACFNPNNNNIYVYTNKRMLADCLRSLAHEIFHFSSNLNGTLNSESGETGSEEENNANAFAGIMLRIVGKKWPSIYE